MSDEEVKDAEVVGEPTEVDDFVDPNPELAGDDGYLPVVANAKALDAMDYEDFFVYLRDNNIEAVDFEGSAWAVVDKAKMIGVPFIIAGAQFHKGTKGPRGFVALRAFTEDKRKIVIVDGSTGIRDQVEAFIAKNGPDSLTGKICRNGLRVSEYTYTDTDAQGNEFEADAKTYYLA